MSLDAQPLNIDAEFPSHIRAKLAEIMAVGPALADEVALLDLSEDVSDALHLGKVDFDDHDALLDEIREARGSLI
ncbi:hypothetical protein EV284_3493 [Streptomyces sp. BK022]|uniref:hypothetical protein n=1 Tax=Streptomyces sp. BK022 TaxID=2512123 RepID=UPI00102A2510|nr:hypothetical protein [Streptomyces sp. BK022]RZU36010.1 hypothetical protein EV284_3493 [Streptomyces sp. BK022]